MSPRYLMSPRYQVLIIGAVLVALALFSYLFVAYLLPLPDGLADKENIPATKIFDRHGTLLYEVLRPETGKVTIIPLQNIPEKFIKATLAAEDANYYSHPGVDFLAIGRAILFNVREQRVVSGASTITQQLVRNMMGDGRSGIGDGSAGGSGAGGSAGGGAGSGAGGSAGGSGAGGRGLTDKMMEALYAVRMSHMYSKDRILELYLNKIYYGNMSYGAQSAATDYFGRNLSDLDLAQSSLLAGLPQSPSSYNPYLNFNKAKKRQKYVLDRMVENDFITREEADAAYEQPIYLRGNKHPMKAPHFVRQVMNRIEADYGAEALFYGGLTVITTLDYDLQMKAERIVKRQVAFLARNNVTNAALVALDPKTAQVLAWVGSADYFNDEIAGSVDIITSLRQPGSSIKPLTYLAALEKGWTPATVIYDIPTQFNTESGPYSPKNYDLRYHGPVRARVALASSYNIPAVKTLEFVGLENFISFLGRLGIGTLDRPAGFYGLALTLGGGEVRVIDMANAFNVIANYGVKKPHSMILDVEGIRSIERILDVAPTSSIDYILGPNGRQHAYQIIDILKDPNARIPGFGEGSVLELSRPAAVKTGTTRNYRDNWTIGFTPDLLVAVWAGNADASPMQNISGVDGAAPIWAEFMEAALQGRPKTDFERPAGLVEMEICALSGKLPTDLCPDRAYEIFARGEEPKEPDDYYKSFNLNVNTGRVVRGECAGAYGSTLSRVVMVDYPRELRKWAAAENLPLPEYEPCSQARGGAGEYADGYAAAYPSEQPDAISIDSPANNDEYLLDSSLPLNDQKIPFRVTVPAGTVTVSYYIAPPILDVAPISSIDPILDVAPISSIGKAPFTYLWPPVKGRHALTAVAETDTGEKSSATVTFIIK